MEKLEFPLLTKDDIEVRIGTYYEGKGMSLLLYKDARVDMKMLDEIVGWNNWKREHIELKGVIYCGVSIWDEEKQQWITKWDAGKESNTEAEKGEASDSFKRACVNATGVGRELYTAPFIWVSVDTGCDRKTKFKVNEIDYNENREISKLVITDEKGKIVYTFGTKQKAVEQPKLKLSDKVLMECSALGIDIDKLAAYLKKSKYQLEDEEVKVCIARKKAQQVN